MRLPKLPWLQVLAHVGSLVPFGLLAGDLLQGRLGADPIREIQFRTGRAALALLVMALASSAVGALLRLGAASRLRRLFGLYAFGYASLHFLNFVAVDYRFDLGLLSGEVAQKRYVIAGLAAFLCLLPLAITSTKGWQTRLGRNWQRLHRLVYVAAGLAVLHFFWEVKANTRQPLLYGYALLLVLALRLASAAIRAVGRRRHPR